MGIEKKVDESWKKTSRAEKEILKSVGENDIADKPKTAAAETADEPSSIEVNFLNYVTSLGFQALIFLGEIPNPITNESNKSIEQAKFIIDTLTMIREKTKGNLSTPEENMLNGSIYELQMKYVEIVKKDQIK